MVPSPNSKRPDTELMSSAEAAQELGYTVQHVRRLVREGRIAGQKLARDWVVRRRSVDEYVAARANLKFTLSVLPRGKPTQ
jgi:excisionase family DNA binding protein